MKESSTDKICQNYRFVIVHLGYEEASLFSRSLYFAVQKFYWFIVIFRFSSMRSN